MPMMVPYTYAAIINYKNYHNADDNEKKLIAHYWTAA